MISKKETLITVFKRILEALNALSEDEVRRLDDFQYAVEIKIARRRSKDKPLVEPLNANLMDTINEITALSSRSDAQAFLDERFPTKKTLEVIARGLDIPIIKKDKVEDIRNKIVEATVGARISSQAIQGIGG